MRLKGSDVPGSSNSFHDLQEHVFSHAWHFALLSLRCLGLLLPRLFSFSLFLFFVSSCSGAMRDLPKTSIILRWTFVDGSFCIGFLFLRHFLCLFLVLLASLFVFTLSCQESAIDILLFPFISFRFSNLCSIISQSFF